MNRHYYISDNLDDLEQLERELEAQGISTEQIHVLSERSAELEQHHLHSVPSLLRKDVMKSGVNGALIGLALAILVLAIAYLAGWTDSAAGWPPFILLAAIVLGFCTWEGGFFGFQQPNSRFLSFEGHLRQGQHVFFVDLQPHEEPLLEQLMPRYPKLQQAGVGPATPYWLTRWQHSWNRFRQMI